MSSGASIQLVLQSAATGTRISIPTISGSPWTPKSTLAQVMETVRPQLELVVNLQQSSIRYVQTTVPFEQWSSTKLKDLNVSSGRTLLILQTATTTTTSNLKPTPPTSTTDNSSALREALSMLYQHNFDVDSKVCIVTLCKVLDNVIQKPNQPKVRTIRLANPAFSQKVAQRKGGVEYLVACGFQRQQTTPPILSRDPGEDILVLPDENGVDTSLLVRARKLLMTDAIQKLGMKADELPKYKPPPPSTTATATASNNNTNSTTTSEFNVYRGQRYDAKSAAVGQQLGPDGSYISPTETQLKQLQSKQARLEAKQQRPLQNREIVAMMPGGTANVSSIAATAPSTSSSSSSKGDSSLLAQQLKRQQEERKKREEGGFTTRAMREVQQLQNQKVYSHATLRIQFPDGCSLSAKFLPKETIATVKSVIQESMTSSSHLQFDLYIAPPRRKLPVTSTLQQEGLVPAAKVIVSWVGGAQNRSSSAVGSYLKPDLFRSAGGGPAFPTGHALTSNNNKSSSSSSSSDNKKPGAKKRPKNKEDDLLKRMMGGGGLGGGGSSSSGGKKGGGGKPKFFK